MHKNESSSHFYYESLSNKRMSNSWGESVEIPEFVSVSDLQEIRDDLLPLIKVQCDSVWPKNFTISNSRIFEIRVKILFSVVVYDILFETKFLSKFKFF